MPYPKDWNPFEGKLKDDINWASAKMRLNKEPRKRTRVSTYSSTIDELMGGGLPEGLTVVYGCAGSGKTALSRTIANNMVKNDKKVIYFVGEDTADSPTPNPPLLNTVNFAAYRPGAPKAIRTILKFIQKMQPDYVVIDSLTTILGETSKAVPEADVREWTGQLAKSVSGVVPVIGISEVRGSGQYVKPAGGWGIAHAGLQMIKMNKVFIEDKWGAQDYSAEMGDVVWTIVVTKDRDGHSKQGHLYRVTYIGDEVYFEEI